MDPIKEASVSQVLTEIAVRIQPHDFVADKIAPIVKVKSLTGYYFEYAIEDTFTLVDTHRGWRDDAKELSWKKTQQPFGIDPFALRDFVPDVILSDNEKAATTELLLSALLLDRERRVKDLALSFSSSGVATAWSDYSNSDPVKDVRDALDSLVVRGNTVVLPNPVFNTLVLHPKITEKLSSVGTKVVTPDKLAEIFDVDAVYVAKAKYNAGKRGKSASLSYVWPQDKVWVGYVAPAPSRNTPSAMYTFGLDGLAGFRMGRRVREWRDEKRGGGGVMLEVELAVDEKVISPALGKVLTGVL